MRIGIDIDDTVMDTFDYLMPYVAEFFGADLDELKVKKISYSDLPVEWQAREKEFGKKYFDKVVLHTPIKPFASDVIKRLKNDGHEIFIVTARDDSIYTDAYRTTYRQLLDNGVEFDELICTFDKAKVCVERGIDLFLDDSIENCRKVNECGIDTFLFNSPANEKIETSIQRVYNWEEVYEKIKSTTIKYRR